MSMAPNVKICTGAILQFDGEAFREANNKCETGCLTDKGMQAHNQPSEFASGNFMQ